MHQNDHAVSDLVAFDKWVSELGISATTAWRWRRKGFLTTVQILGRNYISRAEIAAFEQRASAGEYARSLPATPGPSRSGEAQELPSIKQ